MLFTILPFSAYSSSAMHCESLLTKILKVEVPTASVIDSESRISKRRTQTLDLLYLKWTEDVMKRFSQKGFETPSHVSIKRDSKFTANYETETIGADYIYEREQTNRYKKFAIEHEISHLVWNLKTKSLLPNYELAIQRYNAIDATNSDLKSKASKELRVAHELRLAYEELFADTAPAVLSSQWFDVNRFAAHKQTPGEREHDAFRKFDGTAPLPWDEGKGDNFMYAEPRMLVYYRLAEVRRFIFANRNGLNARLFLHLLAEASAAEIEDALIRGKPFTDREMNARLIEHLKTAIGISSLHQ